MEQSRLLIAILLSLVVFLAWHFIFGSKEAEQQAAKKAAAPRTGCWINGTPSGPYTYCRYATLSGQDIGKRCHILQFSPEKIS